MMENPVKRMVTLWNDTDAHVILPLYQENGGLVDAAVPPYGSTEISGAGYIEIREFIEKSGLRFRISETEEFRR